MAHRPRVKVKIYRKHKGREAKKLNNQALLGWSPERQKHMRRILYVAATAIVVGGVLALALAVAAEQREW